MCFFAVVSKYKCTTGGGFHFIFALFHRVERQAELNTFLLSFSFFFFSLLLLLSLLSSVWCGSQRTPLKGERELAYSSHKSGSKSSAPIAELSQTEKEKALKEMGKKKAVFSWKYAALTYSWIPPKPKILVALPSHLRYSSYRAPSHLKKKKRSSYGSSNLMDVIRWCRVAE